MPSRELIGKMHDFALERTLLTTGMGILIVLACLQFF
jgi:hypothetical protein